MKKYIILLISLFIAALNFNLFLKPLNLVTGGNQGIAIILKHITNLKPSLTVFIINIIALIISYIFLRQETTISLVLSSLTYPLFIRLTNNLYIPSITNIPIIVSIVAGIICGITGGLIYKLNFNQGGISIINTLLHTYLKIKIPITNFIINTSIMLIGSIYFGFIKLIYSLIVISISNLIINIIMSKNNLTKKLS
jgi:uncharacterized membrane-anchored protein YitT (DUF2179 family)